MKIPKRGIIGLVHQMLAGEEADRRLNDGGYVEIRSDRWDLEHRLVAEKILRRRLRSDEHVHHINGKRDDNSPENLCVMSEYDHRRYHKWYDRAFETNGKYPRRETQLLRLREWFHGIPLIDVIDKKAG